MQVYELKRIVEDNFEEEFQKCIGYLPLKEKFYSKRNYKIGLSILIVLLIVSASRRPRTPRRLALRCQKP